MTAGLSLPYDWSADFTFGAFNFGGFGGLNLVDSLNYHKLDPSRTNKESEYLYGGNLLSYVIAERTRMTPLEFAKMKLFPLLGIDPSTDIDWQFNLDGMSFAWHGIFINVPSLAKVGMLYLQHGHASEDDIIVNDSFVLDSTKGTGLKNEYGYYGYGVWLGRDHEVDPAFPERANFYCAGGLGDNVICIDENLDRVFAMTSSNYIPALGGGEIDESMEALAEIVRDPTCSFLD